MSARTELENIKKHIGVAFQRSGDKSNYVKFVEEQAAQEEAKIQAVVSEQNRLMREVEAKKRSVAVQAERRRMQTEESPDIYQVTPRMTVDQLPQGMTTEQVTAAIQTAVAQFRSKIEISKADWSFLCNVMQANEVNATDVTVWETVLSWAISRLENLERGGPIPEKVAPELVVEEEWRNPFPESSLRSVNSGLQRPPKSGHRHSSRMPRASEPRMVTVAQVSPLSPLSIRHCRHSNL